LGFIWSMVCGNLVRDIRKVHECYGDVARIAPDEVSFARKDAMLDIFSQPTGGALPFYKNPIFFKSPPGQPENLVTTINLQENQRLRKVILPPFTERALRTQEPIVIKYAMLLMDKLQEMATAPENGAEGANFNMNDWANFFAFDLIGDLVMGESFECMEGSAYHL
jgi:cytochrome P450